MKIGIGGDHAGFEYKQLLKDVLSVLGHEVLDFGPDTNSSCDYPDHVHPLAQSVADGSVDKGILICGSANGVAITANKYKQVRAAIVWKDELAALARQHNDANIICLPARYISIDEATQFVQTFLSTEFEGGRHANRVDKISGGLPMMC